MNCLEAEFRKSPAIVLLTIVSWFLISVLSWRSFVPTVPSGYGPIVRVVLQSLHIWWMIFWLWGIHNFWHQTLSMLPRRKVSASDGSWDGYSVAILYMTCNDFDPDACASCLAQTHPRVRLIICDDSTEDSYRRAVDKWVSIYPSATVVRRSDRRGFKAGNLNHAIESEVHEEFILVCDADEILPPDMVSRLLPHFGRDGTGFVQAGHVARSRDVTRFAAILGESIGIFYRHCLPLRNKFGFVSCFGHGVMIRRSVWELVGGFPEIVAEDIGFASRALVKGFRGIIAEDVVAEEAFPVNYKAFVTTHRKVIGGTIEYFQQEFLPVLRSPMVSWPERLDILLTFSSCYLSLITIVSLIGGLILSYIYQLQGSDRLPSWLLFVYLVGPLTPILPLLRNLPGSPRKYVRYTFAAALAYVSLIPVLAMKSIEQTLRLRAAAFDVTGHAGRQHQHPREYIRIALCGLAIMAVAALLRSPAMPASVCISTMFLLGPMLCLTERTDAVGYFARHCGVVPYLGLVIARLWHV